jgi:hypothetical protein
MVEYVGAVLEVGWHGELIVRFGVGNDKVVPSLHLLPRAGQSIERCSWAVDPMLAMPNVVRLCISWCRSDASVEGIMILNRNEMEGDGRHGGLYLCEVICIDLRFVEKGSLTYNLSTLQIVCVMKDLTSIIRIVVGASIQTPSTVSVQADQAASHKCSRRARSCTILRT